MMLTSSFIFHTFLFTFLSDLFFQSDSFGFVNQNKAANPHALCTNCELDVEKFYGIAGGLSQPSLYIDCQSMSLLGINVILSAR